MLRGAPADGTVTWDDFLARADQVPADAVAARGDALRGDDLSDVLFTSGTTGKPKGAMLTHSASIRAYASWADVVGLREGDRYLIVNPFFHSFGLKAGILASIITGAHDGPARRLRRRHGDAAGRRGAHLDAARTADRLPVDPRPPARRRLRHVVAAAGGHRRGGGAGRDDQPDAGRARLRDDRHRLRAHRSPPASRRCAATTTTPRRSRRRPGARSPASRSSSSTRTGDAGADRRIGRGRRPRATT